MAALVLHFPLPGLDGLEGGPVRGREHDDASLTQKAIVTHLTQT